MHSFCQLVACLLLLLAVSVGGLAVPKPQAGFLATRGKRHVESAETEPSYSDQEAIILDGRQRRFAYPLLHFVRRNSDLYQRQDRAPVWLPLYRGKKIPEGFAGMRGKKAAPGGFVGFRGKKVPGGFAGLRGKRLPDVFGGLRGKKTSVTSDKLNDFVRETPVQSQEERHAETEYYDSDSNKDYSAYC